MRAPVAATMIASGAFLMVAPATALLAYAETLMKQLDTTARQAHLLHALLCTVVGLILIVVGAARAKE